MDKKNILIISNKFSAGHYSHMVAMYKLLEEIEMVPFMLLDYNYATFVNEAIHVNYIEKNNLFIYDKIDIIIFQNPSKENHILAKQFKKKYGCKVIYIFHEPISKLKDYLIGRNKIKKFIKILGVHYFNNLMLKNSDYVILPSETAKNIYLENKAIVKRPYSVIPLLFDDEFNELSIGNKKYFSYIGTVADDHGFSQYINFIKYYLKKQKKDYGLLFQIVTSSNVDIYIDDSLKEAINKKLLIIKAGKVLTNEEINEAYNNSFLIWNCYYRSTQSGVLPKALMFGTPVIATKIGSFPEFIIHGNNGFLVDKNYKFETILENVLIAKTNINELSKNCRETFNQIFLYSSNELAMKLILDILGGNHV